MKAVIVELGESTNTDNAKCKVRASLGAQFEDPDASLRHIAVRCAKCPVFASGNTTWIA